MTSVSLVGSSTSTVPRRAPDRRHDGDRINAAIPATDARVCRRGRALILPSWQGQSPVGGGSRADLRSAPYGRRQPPPRPVPPGAGRSRPRPRARHAPRTKVGAYVALTKPRIIELLLVTTVPTMVVAEQGLPVARG